MDKKVMVLVILALILCMVMVGCSEIKAFENSIIKGAGYKIGRDMVTQAEKDIRRGFTKNDTNTTTG